MEIIWIISLSSLALRTRLRALDIRITPSCGTSSSSNLEPGQPSVEPGQPTPLNYTVENHRLGLSASASMLPLSGSRKNIVLYLLQYSRTKADNSSNYQVKSIFELHLALFR